MVRAKKRAKKCPKKSNPVGENKVFARCKRCVSQAWIPDFTHAMERPVWSRLGEHFWDHFLEIFLGTLFGALFGEIFGALLGALFGELFAVLVGASIAKISQQPTSNKPHAAKLNQHSAKHLELTARNDPLKQKATLFFFGVHASVLATDRSNVIALPISRILFCKTSSFWELEIFLRCD